VSRPGSELLQQALPGGIRAADYSDIRRWIFPPREIASLLPGVYSERDMNAENPYIKDVLQDRAKVIAPNEGHVIRFKGATITFKVTSETSNDQLGVYEISLEPNRLGAPLHFHRFMDETFIVREGTLCVQHGHEEVDAKAGSVIYIPRFTPHGFRNRSDAPVTFNLVFNPAQRREGYFLGLEQVTSREPADEAEFLALFHRYDNLPLETNRW
jgi:quercetin dioxygenase-like cupin family protein